MNRQSILYNFLLLRVEQNEPSDIKILFQEQINEDDYAKIEISWKNSYNYRFYKLYKTQGARGIIDELKVLKTSFCPTLVIVFLS